MQFLFLMPVGQMPNLIFEFLHGRTRYIMVVFVQTFSSIHRWWREDFFLVQDLTGPCIYTTYFSQLDVSTCQSLGKVSTPFLRII